MMALGLMIVEEKIGKRLEVAEARANKRQRTEVGARMEPRTDHATRGRAGDRPEASHRGRMDQSFRSSAMGRPEADIRYEAGYEDDRGGWERRGSSYTRGAIPAPRRGGYRGRRGERF
jgi:hypothetical protein